MDWRKIKLTQGELEKIHNAEMQVDKPQLLKRLQCIKLKNRGWKHREVAEFLGINPATVSVWIKLYKGEGIEKLLQWGYQGRVSILSPEQQEQLKQRNKEQPFSAAKEAMGYIEEKFDMSFHLHYVQKLLKKNFSFPTRSLS
jgi:transposase